MRLEELKALLMQADEHNNTGKYDEAEQLANEVIEQVTSTQTLHRREGLLDSDSFPKAEEIVERIDSERSRISRNKDWSTENGDILELHISALISLSSSALRKSDYKYALAYAQNALDLASKYHFHALHAKSLSTIGTIHYDLSDYPLALKYYAKALALAEELGDNKLIAGILGYIGIVHGYLSDYTTALQYFVKALAINEQTGNKVELARNLSSIGTVHLNLSDFPTALEYFANAFVHYEELGNKRGMATVLSNVGAVHTRLSDYSRSLEYYSKGLALAEELDNRPFIAFSLGNIGLVYANLSDYSRALEYHAKALALAEELGNKDGIVDHLCNIGIVHMELTHYTLALEYLAKASALAKELDYKSGLITILCCMGLTYSKLNDFDNNLEYLLRALALADEIGNKSLSAGVRASIGDFYANSPFHGRDDAKAEKFLLDAIAISEELKTKNYGSHKSLADLYERQQRWKEAHLHHLKYHQLYIEVQSEEVKKQADRFGWERKIAEMEKEKEVELIRTQAQQQIMQHKIEVLAREVENGIHELVHKNNFLEDLKRELKKLTPYTRAEGLDIADKLEERLQRSTIPFDERLDLERQFTEVHAVFIQHLKEKYPDLTQMELKIAALLKMKLSSSNISSLLCLSKRTVEFHRLNIRKKLGLASTDDIHLHLNNIV